MSTQRTAAGLIGKTFSGIALVAFVCAMPEAHAVAKFGTRCQSSYQDGWLATVPYAEDRCDYLADELDDTDTKVFSGTMKSTGSGFNFDDGLVSYYGVDTVDLFYVSTHGGTSSASAQLARYEKNLQTYSSSWRFGDNAVGASIYSQYACETMKIDDYTWNRWNKAFKGGLRYVTGSHGTVYDSISTDENGENYADELQDGTTLKWAWFDGNWDTYSDADVAVFATGSTWDQCLSRKNNMKWQNFGGYGRLRDGSVSYLCGSWITDY